MKGLLLKDLKLMKMQKHFFAILLVVAVGMAMFGEAEAFSSFIVGYVTFIGGLFTLSTISYDEFDNGNAFLFSLPITRQGYVAEKYCFGVIVGAIFWSFGLVIHTVIGLIRGMFSIDTFAGALLILPMMWVLLSITLPFQLKFGGEKGRIAVLGFIGIVFIAGTMLQKAGDAMNFHVDNIVNNMVFANMGMVVLAIIALAVVALFVSFKISVSIMKRKEF